MTDEGIHHFMSDLVPMVVIVAMVIGSTRVLTLLVAAFRNRAHLRSQTELHNKMLEKFGTTEEFTAYLQSDAGKSLFENLSNEPVAPQNKILGSIQKSAILIFLGIGLIVLGQMFLPFDSGSIMFAVGVISLMIGIGFAVSSIISYRLAKSWGIITVGDSPVSNSPKTVAP